MIKAINNLPDNAELSELSEDWISHFFSKCENISDKQMQSLWSNLLLGRHLPQEHFRNEQLTLLVLWIKKMLNFFQP